jgi:hypothetical protein
MDIIITAVILFVGFIIGLLVANNNSAKTEKIINDALKYAEKAQQEAKDLIKKAAESEHTPAPKKRKATK